AMICAVTDRRTPPHQFPFPCASPPSHSAIARPARDRSAARTIRPGERTCTGDRLSIRRNHRIRFGFLLDGPIDSRPRARLVPLRSAGRGESSSP
ncbi:hypothetical protein, partial [Burkholderia pseudomallei]